MARDEYANYFQVSFKEIAGRNAVWQVIAPFLQKRYFPDAERILDLGAGYCSFINNVTAKERYALDKQDIVRKYVGPGVQALVQDCTDLRNFKDGSLDAVFASNLLEHLPREGSQSLIGEARRVLRSGGRLVLLQPNFTYSFRHYFDDFTHVQIFTHTGLEELLIASGFKVIANVPKFMPFSMRSRLPRVPFLVRLYLISPWKPFAGQMLVVAEK